MYKYLGKEVEVVRFSSNDTAQLADGTWVPSAMLMLQPDSRVGEYANETATIKRAKKSENN